MTRQQAGQLTRELLNANGLNKWHVAITADLTRTWLGKCSYQHSTIFLNSFHIDTHPTEETDNTIRHEVAHALCPNHQHDEVWRAKARELGCTNTQPCASYGLDERAIDAIRSGQVLEVTFEEQVVRTPKYKIGKLQEKCPTCGKVAEELMSKDYGDIRIVTLKCLHIITRKIVSSSPFHQMVSNDWKVAIKNCKHEWAGTRCNLCGEFRLYDYQVEGAKFLEKANGRAALFDEMGLGKTVQSLAWIRYNQQEALPVLFVVKSGIKYQWAKEIVRWLGIYKAPQVITTSKDALIPAQSYIISYDMMVPKSKTLKSGKIINSGFDINKFKDVGIKTVVLDECQQIKNVDSTRTQMVRAICREIGHIIPLSGTPWKNRGSEFFPVLNMLDSTKFSSYENFKRRWVDTYWDAGREKEGGIRNIKQFKEYTQDIIIRRERSEVMKELPAITRNMYYCDMDDEREKEYDKQSREFTKFYNEAVIGGDDNGFEFYQNALARITKMRHLTGVAKIPHTLEFARDFLEETERKLVIFVHHKDVGAEIYDSMCRVCSSLNLPQPKRMTADLSPEARFEVQEWFNKTPQAVLVASTLAAGEGLNLQTCADCIIHERQWNPANEEQAEGRFIRIGQQANAVTATYTTAKDTIDQLFHEIVERKRVQYHAAMNKGEAPTWNETGLIKELAAAIAKQRR